MTVLAALRELKRRLADSGVEDPAFEADCILEKVGGISRKDRILRGDSELSQDVCDRMFSLCERRKNREPLQYLLGSWTFMRREFAVGEGVLIPRDDTEVAVRAALERLPKNSAEKVLDLCSGSGIIAVTLKCERPATEVAAVEKSADAFRYLEENCRLHRADIACLLSDLSDCAGDFPDESLDLIISNPPYIRTNELFTLQEEVRHEPAMALDGGESGYDFYEKILSLYTPKLKLGGHLIFEIGEGQLDRISDLLSAAGFKAVESYPDIQNIPRAVTAVRTVPCGE